MLDDPAERDLFVYLPAGYEESVRRYATVYLLHAFGQSAESVVTPSTDARGGGRRSRTCWIGVRPDGVRPMIVVIPDGSCRWGCGQWVDSAGSGYFESYVAEDVVAFVDSTYRTVADSCSRGGLRLLLRLALGLGTSSRRIPRSSPRWRFCRRIPISI